MMLQKSTNISLARAIVILILGVITGIQLALYLYDYYDDGVAELLSLFIGVGMLLLALGFVFFTFITRRNDRTVDGQTGTDHSAKS